jgi:hypothetical protein
MKGLTTELKEKLTLKQRNHGASSECFGNEETKSYKCMIQLQKKTD